MSIEIVECTLSELDTRLRKVITGLLQDEEPLFCYQKKESHGLISPNYSFRAWVITASEIIDLSSPVLREVDQFLIIYLDTIRQIRQQKSSDIFFHITIHDSNGQVISFPFENQQMSYTFTYRLRHAIRTARSRGL